jgi:hypothetical protein
VSEFDYPRAGKGAIPALAHAVEQLLTEVAARGAPPWRLGPSLVQGFMLGSGTGPLKMSKADAAYKAAPVGQQRCGNCSSAYRQLVTGELICSQVEGEVKADHWCRIWNTDRN